jgi:hypothetical protein
MTGRPELPSGPHPLPEQVLARAARPDGRGFCPTYRSDKSSKVFDFCCARLYYFTIVLNLAAS